MLCRSCASTGSQWHAACVGYACDRRGGGKRETGMDREQLIQRLRARVRRGGPAEQVWWNGELLHVSEAIMRAAELSEQEPIRARGDDVVIPRMLRDN
jgi:hypothetical protein